MTEVSARLQDDALWNLIQADVPFGDLTTDNLGISNYPGQATFRARQPMRLCAIEEAARIFELCGAHPDILLPSGSDAPAGVALLRAAGSAGALHRAWKVSQTLLEYASGIAGATADIVATLKSAGFDTPVACTRKNFPGTKAIAVKAVLAGGGTMHRLGLSETLLVFQEHLAFLQSDQHAKTLATLRRRCPEKKLVAEATTLADAMALASAGVDVLQLEKFTPDEVATCCAALRTQDKRPVLAVAGGVMQSNAIAYAEAGADLLVTSAPYFAKPAEVAVSLIPDVN